MCQFCSYVALSLEPIGGFRGACFPSPAGSRVQPLFVFPKAMLVVLLLLGASYPPRLPANVSWTEKHGPAETTPHMQKVAFCLFGIPASIGGKAGQMNLRTSMIAPVAQMQLAMLPPHVDVYSHAWKPRNSSLVICERIEHAYLPRAHICEDIIFDTRKDLITPAHVQSMILSITKVLKLSSIHPYDQTILTRHDSLFCDRMQFFLPGQFVVFDNDFLHPEGSKVWRNSRVDGVPDLAFAGDPITLEYVFKTLYTRLVEHEKFSRDNTRAHFVIQQHLDDSGLTQRRYVKSFQLRVILLRDLLATSQSCVRAFARGNATNCVCA